MTETQAVGGVRPRSSERGERGKVGIRGRAHVAFKPLPAGAELLNHFYCNKLPRFRRGYIVVFAEMFAPSK